MLVWKNLRRNELSDVLGEKQTTQQTLPMERLSQSKQLTSPTSNKLMVMGGADYFENYFTIETYCLQTNTWTVSHDEICVSDYFNNICSYALIDWDLYISGWKGSDYYESVRHYRILKQLFN